MGVYLLDRVKVKLQKNAFVRYWYFCCRSFKRHSSTYKDIPRDDCRYEFFLMKSYGMENRDKVYYLIDYDCGHSGFFAIYRGILQLMYICNRMQWKPYVMVRESHYNDIDGDNVFDYFFEQPSNISYEEIKSSFNVVQSQNAHMKWVDLDIGTDEKLVGGYEADNKIVECLAEISHKYIHLKNTSKKQLRDDIDNILEGQKTVGIHYRGNAYAVGFYGHPVKLDIEDYYSSIDECINNGYKRIFVATDEVKALNSIINKYGKMVTFFRDTFRSENGVDIHEQSRKIEKSGRRLAYEVLRDMHTLATCDAMICGKSQVTISAQIEKRSRGQKFDYLKILDKGLYGADNPSNISEYRKKVAKYS